MRTLFTLLIILAASDPSSAQSRDAQEDVRVAAEAYESSMRQIGDFVVEWDRVDAGSQSGTTTQQEITGYNQATDVAYPYFHPRYEFVKQQLDSRVGAFGSDTTLTLFNGQESSVLRLQRRPDTDRISLTGIRIPGLAAEVWARGNTVLHAIGVINDLTPLEKVLRNGSFKVERSDDRAITLLGRYALAEEGADVLTAPNGMWLRVTLSRQKGHMPVRFELGAVVDSAFQPPYETRDIELQSVGTEGVWFPQNVTVSAKDDETTRLTTRSTLRVRAVDLDPKLDASDFTMSSWPPGTYVEDRVTETQYRVPTTRPAELDQLARATSSEQAQSLFVKLDEKTRSDWERELILRPTTPRVVERPSRSNGKSAWGVAVAGVGVLTIVTAAAYVMYRIRAKT